MEWKTIRSAFIRQRGTRKQEAIAQKGGLRQSDISKLEANDKLGPQVETFVKAVQGLGLPVSVFFAQLENQASAGLQSGAPYDHDAPQSEATPHGPTLSEDAVGLEILVRGLADTIDRAADRVVDHLQSLASDRARTTPDRPRRRAGRKKAS